MTPNEFRALALSFPHTEQREHMQHPDFRVAGKIFATMGYPDKTRAMVKVTPAEQEMLVQAEPDVFSPVNGAWGRKGCTSVLLKPARKESLRRALAAAWELHAPSQVREKLARRETAKNELSVRQRTSTTRAVRKGERRRKAAR